jgi:hypothetical protein
MPKANTTDCHAFSPVRFSRTPEAIAPTPTASAIGHHGHAAGTEEDRQRDEKRQAGGEER